MGDLSDRLRDANDRARRECKRVWCGRLHSVEFVGVVVARGGFERDEGDGQTKGYALSTGGIWQGDACEESNDHLVSELHRLAVWQRTYHQQRD